MAKTVLCAGGCGSHLHGGRGSLPEGQRKCRGCRRRDRTADHDLTRRYRGPSRVCLACGTSFIAYRASMKTCSLKCGQRYRLATHGPARPRKCWQCEVCGSDYRRSYSGQRTCGRACGVALKARSRPPAPAPTPPPSSVCAQCGDTFEASRQRYCSARCAAEAKRASDRARSAARPKVHPPGKCRQCGKDIARGAKCADCLATSRLERKRRERRRRRVLKRGAAAEPYTLAEIAARDRNVCQLCRRRVAMTKAVPHPKAPTIDHVLPLAAGGDDTRANVQLAHFECNWMKRDGGTQQLALVG